MKNSLDRSRLFYCVLFHSEIGRFHSWMEIQKKKVQVNALKDFIPHIMNERLLSVYIDE